MTITKAEEWISPGNDKDFQGFRIVNAAANSNTATLQVYPPWGGIEQKSVLLGSNGWKITDATTGEYLQIYYLEGWAGSRGYAVRLSLTHFKADAIKYPKGQINTFSTYKVLNKIGDVLGFTANIRNLGFDGRMYLWVGVGYIDNSNEIIFTGTPYKASTSISPGHNASWTKNITIQKSDYNAQKGIGWAYSPKQMKVFSLLGHYEGNKLIWDDDANVNIVISEPYIAPPVVDPVPPRGIITRKSIDRNLVDVDTAIEYTLTVKNTGDTGRINIQAGIGYIDDNNQMVFTGSNISESHDINGGGSYAFIGTINVKQTDYYAQAGTGWAYKPKQLKVFFITDHDDANLNIVVNTPPDYEDPTDLPDLPGFPGLPGKPDEPDEPENIGPGFGFGKVTFKMPSVLKEFIKRMI